jgi:hypothetical protein
MRSCASDEENRLASGAYELPADFDLLQPRYRTVRRGDDFESPGEIDVLPETPPPRFFP